MLVLVYYLGVKFWLRRDFQCKRQRLGGKSLSRDRSPWFESRGQLVLRKRVIPKLIGMTRCV